MYKQIGETWKKVLSERTSSIKERAIIWRREPAISRVDRPSRLDKARRLGYRAKQGFIAVRARVGRGGMRRQRPRSGRRPKHLGVTKIKSSVSMQRVAERRVLERYPNMRLLGSYYLYQDGRYSWYEILLADPNHPSVTRSVPAPPWKDFPR